MGQSAAHLAHPSPLPPPPHLYPLSPIITELKQRRFWVMQLNWKWVLFPKICPLLLSRLPLIYETIYNVPEKCWPNHCPSMQKVNFLLINNWSVSCKNTFVYASYVLTSGQCTAPGLASQEKTIKNISNNTSHVHSNQKLLRSSCYQRSSKD